MMEMSVRSNIKEAMRDVGRLERGLRDKVIVGSLNDTAKKAKSIAVRTIAKEMGVPAKRIRGNLHVWRASRMRLLARLWGDGLPLPLIDFKARQTRKGVTATAYGKRRVYKRAFIATMGSHRGVFTRKGRARTPVKELWGPGVPGTFADRVNQRAMTKAIKETFPKAFQRRLRYQLLKKRGVL